MQCARVFRQVILFPDPLSPKVIPQFFFVRNQQKFTIFVACRHFFASAYNFFGLSRKQFLKKTYSGKSILVEISEKKFFPKKFIFSWKIEKIMIFFDFASCLQNALKSRIFVRKAQKKFWKEFYNYVFSASTLKISGICSTFQKN
jgi:hypothetical protein